MHDNEVSLDAKVAKAIAAALPSHAKFRAIRLPKRKRAQDGDGAQDEEGLTTTCYLLTDATSPPTTDDALEYRCGLPFDNHREARQTRCPEQDRTTNRRTERYGDSHFTLDSAHKRRVASSILEDGATTDTATR